MDTNKYRRKKSSGITFFGIALIIISLIGIILIIIGVWWGFTHRGLDGLATPLFLIPGVILFLTGVILWVTRKEYTKKGPEEKKDYMNLDWLKHQHYVLGRSFRDIAEDQNISMIRIKKWIDKLENSSKE